MSRRLSFDTETKGFDWWDKEQQAFLATWADEQHEEVADLGDNARVLHFAADLAQADEIVAHNLSFDVHQTRATLGFDILEMGKVLHDTDILSRVVLPPGGMGAHKLKNLATVHLGVDGKDAENAIVELAAQMGMKLKDSEEIGSYYDVWQAYPEEMERYALLDARYTYDLFDVLWSKADDAARKVYALEQEVMPVLIRAEAKGVALDQEPVLRLRDQYTEQRTRTHEFLAEELGEAALGGKGSDAALLDALVDHGIPLHRLTPTGQLATNHFALQEFEDDFPLIGQLFEWRQANKFLTTYIEPMVGRDVVHPNFMQCGAWTGRMSCRRPNMQNIPKRAGKEVREMFVPRPSYAFVVCDYDSIEVRLLAWYLGDEGFRALIDSGHDPHAWMAANIHGGEPSEYAKDGPNDDVRSSAKNTLFAITYGAGAPRVSDMNKITKEQAKGLISKIKSSLPGYYRLNKRIREKIEDCGYVNTLWGRTQYVNKDKSYVGLNALIQGSAADIMKQGLVNVDAAVRPLGGIPLLVVHDEVVVEVPIENAEECLIATEAALVSAYDLSPRLAVTGSIVTTNYADA